MDVDFIRGVCMALPHTTEKVQWGFDLVFKVGGKMYAVSGSNVAGGGGPHEGVNVNEMYDPN